MRRGRSRISPREPRCQHKLVHCGGAGPRSRAVQNSGRVLYQHPRSCSMGAWKMPRPLEQARDRDSASSLRNDPCWTHPDDPRFALLGAWLDYSRACTLFANENNQGKS